MDRGGRRELFSLQNSTRMRKSSNTLKLMPWEIRHQHTMRKYLDNSSVAKDSDEVTRQNRISPNYLHHTNSETGLSIDLRKVKDDDRILSSYKENVGNPQESHAIGVKSVKQEETPYRVPDQISHKALEGTCVLVGKALPRRLCFIKSQNLTSEKQTQVAEALPLKEKVFNVCGNLLKGTEVNHGQLHHSQYEFNINKNRMQLPQQTDATLSKSLKYAKKYNLDEIFNYAFPSVKEPLHNRLL